MKYGMESMTPQQTRARLSADDWIAGGLKLLADEGVTGVKIDVLATRLGVTKGSFYWHFDSLPAFLEALTKHYCAVRSEEAEALDDAAPTDPRERLLYMMQRISDPATRSLERAVRAWAGAGNPRLAEHVRQIDAWGFNHVLRCFEQLGFGGFDAQVRAKTLYYAGVGFVHTGSIGKPERTAHRTALLDLLTQPTITVR
jgi:AcrR family transcriptional regulator